MKILEKAKKDKASIYLNQDFGFETISEQAQQELSEKISSKNKILLLAAAKMFVNDGKATNKPFGQNGYDGGLVVLQDSVLFVGKEFISMNGGLYHIEIPSKYITEFGAVPAGTKRDIYFYTKDKTYVFDNINQKNIDDMLMKFQIMKDYVSPKKPDDKPDDKPESLIKAFIKWISKLFK